MVVASQVKDNADAVMISETKLDDTFPVDKVLANPSELISTKMGVASCSLFMKTYQQDLFL